MQYRKFGKIDFEVSALGFGCMRLPTIDGNNANIDQEQVNEMIHTAIEAGVNYFDTAYPYHSGQSEVALGKALQGGLREKIQIASKSPIWLVEKAEDFDRLLDEQLERLQVETIDFYLLHALNRGSWEKIKKLDLISRAEAARDAGKIRFIGFSFHDDLEVFKEIVDGYDAWDFCQIQYNYMDTEYQAGTEGLQYAASKGLAVVIMESLRGGKLAADIPSTKELWASTGKDNTPADWALQWLWNQPEVTLALSGMSTLEQVQQNIVSAEKSGVGTLSEDELALFDKVKDAIEAASPIPCTACEYCMPCPNGVNIPRNFQMYNEAAMYNDLQGARFAYNRFMQEDARAANCIQCDECISKCPQNIPISTWMPVVDDVLGQGKPLVKSV